MLSSEAARRKKQRSNNGYQSAPFMAVPRTRCAPSPRLRGRVGVGATWRDLPDRIRVPPPCPSPASGGGDARAATDGASRYRAPKRDCSLPNLSGGGARLGSSSAEATALASRSKLIRSMPRST